MSNARFKEESLRNKFGLHASANTIAKISLKGTSLVQMKILTILLPQAVYGEFSLWISLATLLAALSYGTFVASIWRFLQKLRYSDSRESPTLLSTAIIGSCLVLCLIGLPVLALHLIGSVGFLDSNLYLPAASISLLIAGSFALMRIVLATSGSEQNSKEILTFNVAYGLSSVLTTIAFAYFYQSLLAVLLGVVLGYGFPVILTLLIKVRQYGLTSPSSGCFKKVASYGIPETVGDSARLAVPFLTTFSVSLWNGLDYAATWAVAISVASLFSSVLNPFFTAYQAYQVKNFELGDFDKGRDLTTKLVPLFLSISMLGALTAIAFSRELVLVISTSDYIAAALVLPLTVVAALISEFSQFWKLQLNLAKRTKTIAFIYVFSLLPLMTICYFAIPLIGIIGAGVAMVVHSLVVMASNYSYGNRAHPIAVRTRSFMIPILAFMAGLVLYQVLITVGLPSLIPHVLSLFVYIFIVNQMDILTQKRIIRLIKMGLGIVQGEKKSNQRSN